MGHSIKVHQHIFTSVVLPCTESSSIITYRRWNALSSNDDTHDCILLEISCRINIALS